MSQVTRYPRPLALLHWLLALMIIAALVAGTVLLGDKPNSDPSKVMGLRMHMIMGVTIGAVMVVRLIIRLRATLPPHADAGHPLLNLAAGAAHVALYLLVFSMVGSGMALAIQSGLPGIVFGGQGILPETFAIYAPRIVHGLLANVLILVILAHVAGAIYHQLILKDGLMARMRIKR